METTELLKKVRKLEIKTKGISNNFFSGEYHSAFKGKGIAFNEVREYQIGDDIRSIDWNVTARFNHPFVKVYEEERELTVMLLVDVSESADFGTHKQFKNELITEICAVLAFSAINNNDKAGVILFSDKIERFIPPKKGKTHILRIIRELLEFQPSRKGTDIKHAIEYFNNVMKRRCITFIISDFLNKGFDEPLKIAGKKHDVIAIRITDEREHVLPKIGLIRIEDAETGVRRWIDTSSKRVRKNYSEWWKEQIEYTNRAFAKSGIDIVDLKTGRSYIEPLMRMFKKRG